MTSNLKLKKILCYPFKLKCLNKKNYFTLKKYKFFPVNIKYIYENNLNYIEKITFFLGT